MAEKLGAPLSTPIAVIGMGAIMPKAESAAQFWRNILDGLDCIEAVPESRWRLDDHFNVDRAARDKTYCRVGGFIPDIPFDPLDYGLPPTLLESIDTAQLLALVVARAALADSGYPVMGKVDHRRTACVLGVAGSALENVGDFKSRLDEPIWLRAMAEAGIDESTARDVVARIKGSFPELNENTFPGFLANIVPGRIANRFDLGAASYAVDAACASALCAVRLACGELERGDCDLAVTGGVDTNNSIMTFVSFSKTPALSPSERIRPFDASGDGTLVSEGVGMIVLKRLADAQADGDRIYGVIRGVGASSDGRGGAIYAPHADGQVRAIKAALAKSGIAPATVGLIEAHATGTAIGDAVELEALIASYGEGRDAPAVLGSVKSQIGHTKAAAGAASLIKTVLALHQRVLPPSIGVANPLPGLAGDDAPMVVLNAARPWPQPVGHPRRAGVSAFGFGGANYHVILEEYAGPASAPAHSTPRSEMVDVSMRDGGSRRVAIVARDARERAGLLAAAADGKADPSVFDCEAGPSGGLVAVFSGQGSQYIGMGARLAIDHPAFAEQISGMNAALARAGRGGCDEVMFPPERRTAPARAAQRGQLSGPLYAQACVGVFSAASHAILAAEGFGFSAAIGHSFGELSALRAVGALDADSFADLVVARGLSLTPPDGVDAGTLIAVHANLARVEAAVAAMPGISIANINAPEQIAVGGSSEAVVAAMAAFAAMGIQTTRLAVGAGFHTPSVAYAREPWQAAVSGVVARAPSAPVYANTTGKAYPAEPAAIQELLAAQPFAPVRFVEQVEAAYAAGGRVFLEIGPRAVLAQMIGQILGDRPHVVLATNPDPHGDSSLQLHRAIARLKALGVPHTAAAPVWEAPREPSRTQVMLAAHGVVSDKSRRLAWRAAPAPIFAAVEPKPASAPAEPTAQPIQAGVSESHREFLAGQMAIARALLDGRAASNPASLAMIREVHDSGARLHEQYLRDQTELSIRMLGASAGLPAVSEPQRIAPSAPPARVPAPAIVEPPSAAEPVAAAGAGVGILEQLRALVAQITGYPEDFIDATMDLEADLGIDSIKRMQILAAFRREHSGQPPAGLAGARTLASIALLLEGEAGSAPVAVLAPTIAAPGSVPAAAGGVSVDTIYVELRRIVAEKTGYPEEMLEPAIDLEADLGIDSIKRMEILASVSLKFGISRAAGAAPARNVGTLAKMAELLRDALEGPAASTPVTVPVASTPAFDGPTGVSQAELRDQPAALAGDPGWLRGRVVLVASDGETTEELVAALAARGATAVSLDLWPDAPALTGLDDDRHHLALAGASEDALREAAARIGAGLGAIAGLVLLMPRREARDTLERTLEILRVIAPLLETAGGRLLTVTRIDGALGFAQADLADCDMGGVAGAVKTAAREWPGIAARVLDIAPGMAAQEAIVAELLDMTTEIVAEIALAPGHRRVLGLAAPRVAMGPRGQLSADETILITGGARGVTAHCALGLARHSKARIVLMGRTPRDEPEPDWARGVPGGDLRAAAGRHLRGAGQQATPREMEALSQRVLAAREVVENLSALNALTPHVDYIAVDLANGGDTRAAIAALVARSGPVTGIVHGAGALSDRRIADIQPGDFARVFGPKVDGLTNLLSAVDPGALRRVAVFSSTAGYFGNPGQAIYAIANEVLNKRALALAASLPRARVVSMGWGPWEGGMVTPELAARFRGRGISPLPIETGVEAFLDLFLAEALGGLQFVIGGPPEGARVKSLGAASGLIA